MFIATLPKPAALSITAALLVLTGGRPAAAGTTYHVAVCGDDSWSGVNSVCASPGGPTRTIQAAIDASPAGDIAVVHDGIYTGPGNRDMDFGGRAITLRSASGAAACIIDCQASLADQHRALRLISGETSTSVLEGFTIKNGFKVSGG